MMQNHKMTTIPSTASDFMPSVLVAQLDSNKAKLEAAWQLSLAMHNIGKPPLASMPTAGSTMK